MFVRVSREDCHEKKLRVISFCFLFFYLLLLMYTSSQCCGFQIAIMNASVRTISSNAMLHNHKIVLVTETKLGICPRSSYSLLFLTVSKCIKSCFVIFHL